MNTPGAGPANEGPTWRVLAELPLSQAAFVAARSQCDPSTVYVTCIPGETSFAVAGQDAERGWHWAIFSAFGIRLDYGWEETQNDAQRVAMEVRRLWSHRCEARARCGCANDCR